MTGNEGHDSKTSSNVSLGKEIDAALGDVIRGLLKKPAEEAGSLLADGIGILGDRVRRKRHLNAQLGLEDTRAMLETKGVQLLNITPPDEEDLQVLLDGMSLAGDEKLRKLWSGLLASTLDPDGVFPVERPFTSAIASLSPADARIMEYAAFVTQNNKSIELDARKAAGVETKQWLTVGDADRVEKERLAMGERLRVYLATASQMESDFDLLEIVGREGWSDNLVRLGIICAIAEEYSPATRAPNIRRREVEGRDLAELLEFIERRIGEAESLALEGLKIRYLAKRDEQKQWIKLGVGFTRFGEKFCVACGVL
jgi:hypothetical protein